jgi:hypothetical protein
MEALAIMLVAGFMIALWAGFHLWAMPSLLQIVALWAGFHLWAMPSLLQIVLEALGHDFTFIQCLAFWSVGLVIIQVIKGIFNKSSK